jgi:hypothetical protein
VRATFGERLLHAGASIAFGLLLATRAYAGSATAENVATARELYKQGADALDANDAKTAVEKLTAAWSLVQTPVIGYDLARAHLALGHLVAAREAALAVVRTGVAPDETDRSTRARTDATKLADQIAPRIPHVTPRIKDMPTDHTVTVKFDGVVVPTAALGVPRQTDPGTHAIVVDVDDGRHVEASVTVAEREAKDVTVELPAPKPGEPGHGVTSPPPGSGGTTPVVLPPPPGAERRNGGAHPLVWIGVATGAVGFVAGAVFGGLALSSSQTVRDNCTIVVGSDRVCPPPYAGDLSDAKTFATVSTIGFVVAGVGVAMFVTGLVLGPSKAEKTATLAPFLGPVSGLRGTF